MSNNDKVLKLAEEAKNLIIEQGYDVSFGARPLKRLIQKKLETAIARKLLENDILPNSTFVADSVDDEIVVCIK